MLVRAAGLKNVLVTNGYVNPEPLDEILPYIDAMNIDLKAFTGSFYRKICGGTLEPVLETIARSAAKCHVEVATLVIPGLNSGPAEISSLASWIASVSPDITLHLNRHHPDYRMPNPYPVTKEELFSLADIARCHLANVRCGNI
jgi:pyruvate formate lyase activating enzyme